MLKKKKSQINHESVHMTYFQGWSHDIRMLMLSVAVLLF
jgi:hypothetical protein